MVIPNHLTLEIICREGLAPTNVSTTCASTTGLCFITQLIIMVPEHHKLSA